MRKRVPKMRIDLVPLPELQRWPRNPRAHNDQASLGASFERFGFVDPIIVDERTGRIVAGHGRLEKLQELRSAGQAPPGRVEAGKGGEWLVPVLRGIEFRDEHEAEAYLLACNRIGDNSGWDEAELAAMLSGHTDNVSGIGWSEDEVLAMVEQAYGELPDAAPEVEAPESDDHVIDQAIPELPKAAVSRPGDIWALGDHRLACGDCRDPQVHARLLAGVDVNVAFTSPPYASQRKYDESSGFKPIHPDEYVDWFEAVQSNVRHHLAVDGSWFVNIKEHSDEGQRVLYVKELTVAHVRQWGWRFVDELCWLRQSLPGDPASMRKFKNGWEPIFHYARGTAFRFRPKGVRYESVHAFDYQTQKAARRKLSAATQGFGNNTQSAVGHGEGFAYPSNVLDIMEGAKVVGHAAAFPAKLPSFFIRAYTDVGDAVLDPFMGSGTTLIAAQQLNRTCFGIELSPAYCDVIVERWQQLTGKKARRAVGKQTTAPRSTHP